jgi:threonine dehydratase
MPETAPSTKVDGVKRWGGEVYFAGTTSEDRFTKATAMAEAEGLTVVPPYDHPDIIAGQGTVGLEILEDLPAVRNIAVPVGGGGLLAGIATAVHALRPDVRLTGVEPEGSAALRAALEAGTPVRLERTASIADGLLPLSVGRITFSHVKGIVDGITVTDEAIAEATVWLRGNADVLAETSGAATTAALRSRALMPAGPTVLLVSGGNIDPANVDALARA